MSELIHADIFFFVTTLVVIILGFFATIVFVLVVRILLDIRRAIHSLRKEGEDILGDLHALRSYVKKNGHIAILASSVVRGALRVIGGVQDMRAKRATRRKKTQEEDD